MTLTDLYETFENRLRRYAIRLARDSYQADDLVQETFIRAMGHLELLKQLNKPQREAWLCQTLKHLFFDNQRARQREQLLAEQLSQQTRITSNPLSEVEFQDLLNHIPDCYRELLHKRYVLGMTSREIAQELSIPPATVRSRLHIAIKWLRANKSRFL